ncbi:MAG: hypothetical protein R3C24_07140 [Cyanobacteriota/Melainabacteria group bacterium]
MDWQDLPPAIPSSISREILKLISDSIVGGAKVGDKLKHYQYPQMDIVMDEVILGVLERTRIYFRN